MVNVCKNIENTYPQKSKPNPYLMCHFPLGHMDFGKVRLIRKQAVAGVIISCLPGMGKVA